MPISCSQFARRAAVLLPMLVIQAMALAGPANAQRTKTPLLSSLSAMYSGYSDGGLLNVGVNSAYAVSVLPDNQSQVTSPSGYVTFYVQNTGTVSASFNFTINCSCSLDRLSATILPGSANGVQVKAYYGSYRGNMVLTATGPGVSDTGSINLGSETFTVSVGPDGYPDYWLEAGQAGTATFTVSNVGNSPATYSLSGSCDAVAIGCSAPPASVPVSPGNPVPVPITFTAGIAGSAGDVRLNASGPSSDGGTVHVRVYSHTASVTAPAGVSVDPGNYTASFSVTNTGNVQTTYNLGSTCGAPITGCSASLGQITLDPNTTTPVSVPYTAVNRGDAGTVTLNASWVGNGAVNASNAMSVSVKHSYAVAVLPDNQSQVVSPSGSVTFFVRNDGSVRTSFSLSANCQSQCTLSASTVTLDPGVSSQGQVIVSLNGYTGTVILTASDQAHGTSDTGSITTSAPTYTVSVGPDGIPDNWYEAGQAGTANFTVSNSGNSQATYSLAGSSCDPVATGCSFPTSVSVGATSSQPVLINFTAGLAGSDGYVRLNASGPSSDGGTFRVRVYSHTASITPPAGVSVDPGNYNASFTVRNTGNVATTYNLGSTCGAPITGCSASLGQIALDPNATTSVSVPYTAVNRGDAGSVTLTASWVGNGAVNASAPMSVSVKHLYVVAVLPDNQTQFVSPSGSVSFFAQNLGTDPNPINFQFSANCSPTCTLSQSSASGVNKGASNGVQVTVNLNGYSGSPVIFTASDQAHGASDTGSIIISAPTYTVSVTPDTTPNTVPQQVDANQPGSQTFYIFNSGNSAASYTISVSCPFTYIASCSWPTSPLQVAPQATDSVRVTFMATGNAGVGTITLTASAQNTSDAGTARWQVNVVSTRYSLVTPKGGTANVYVGPNRTQVFSVKNTGNVPNSYTLTTPCLNAVTACTAAPASISNLPSGDSKSITVTYTASAVGTGTVRLATSNTVDPAVVDTGSVNVTVNPAITVTVSPTVPTVNVEPGTSTQTFTIATNSSTSVTYNLTPACSGVVTGCTASAGSVAVTSSTPAQVNVTYSAATRGATGTVGLTALSTDGSSSGSGSASVSVNAATVVGTNSVQFKDINPGTTIERSQCLIFSIVADVASECGALRIVHPLPAVRTLGKTRVPTLIYSSDQTQGPTLAVNVTLQDTVTIPTSVQLVIVRTWPDAHLDTLTRTYAGSDWQGNRSRRLAMPNVASGGTGILRYRVAVRLVYPSGTVLAAPVDSSELAYVDRTSSSFGGGWWLAGLERLHFGQYDASVLWVAGDGSTRKYVKTGTDSVYLATALDRPDTLFRRADGMYQRQAGNGLYVEFDGYGLHKRTVNRLGYATVFTYDGSSRLNGLQLPPSTSAHSYTFAYNASSGLLETVTAPPVNGKARNVILGRNGASKVVSITEQLDSTYQVTFDASSSLIYTSRTDRRGVPTYFTTETSSPTIATFATATGTGTDIVRHTFRTVSGIGAADGTTESVDSTYLRYDGPRLAPQVLDITKFWLDRFGAPVRIVNALNQETRITRGDPRFPALVTETRGPNLFTSRATYDERGNLKTTTQVNPYGDQVDATTTYWYHSKWNMVTQVIQPEGEVTNIVYDDATGDRKWQEDGRGSMSRVSFQYYTTTDAIGAMARLLSTVTLPPTTTLASASTQIKYDSLGNVKTTITPRGFWTRATNDAIGRTVQTADQISSAPLDSSTTTLTYDLSDRVTKSVSYGPAMNGAGAQSAIVDNVYDREGRLTKVTRTQTPDVSRVFLQDTYPALGSLVLRYRYDNLGRKLAEIAPDSTASDSTDNPVDYSFYDLAGNVTSVQTRRNHVIQMTYDVLNRLKTRTLPEARYTARVDGYAKADPNNSPYLYAVPYPRFPNNPDTASNAHDSPYHLDWGGYTVSGNVATFDYDSAGNMTKADNADARVHRQYYPNGQVRLDSLYTQTLEHDTTALHKYGLEYVYDREGRQKTVKHPVQLSPAPGYVTTSQYDPITGALLRVSDPIGYTFTYGYDARNQTISLAMPGNFNERYTYDQDGNQLTQWSGTTAALHNVTMTYDPRGKMLTLINAVAGHDSAALRYSGLGNLVYNDNVIWLKSTGATRQRTTENFTYDPLGNRLHSDVANSTQDKVNNCSFWSPCHRSYNESGDRADWYYQTGTGRLVFNSHDTNEGKVKYDEAGNTVFSAQKPTVNSTMYEDRASYYGADGVLAAVDFRQISSTTWKIAFDEYRYDALGRRVVVRSRRLCGGFVVECNQSYVRRTIWAGSQELYEIQMPDTTVLREYDTQIPPTRAADGNGYDPNPMYGRVAYTFGLKLDQPLTVIRLGYKNSFSETWSPFSIVPLWTVRGTADTSYFAATGAKNCNATKRCVLVAYGSQYWTPAYSRYFVPTMFQGTLLTDKSDHTGQQYRRNRYYDPGTGRFTQEDPIGLAGGLNAYGFANGDPVNFSDPFGLCPRDAGGDGKTEGYADCPKRSSGYYANEDANGRGGFVNDAKGAAASCKESPACSTVAAVGATYVGGLVIAEAGSLFAGSAELQLTQTVAKHAASRPYLNSQLLAREIMSAGKGIADPGGVAGALRWDVAGAFNKSKGVWELVVDPRTKTILHFVFKSVK